MFVTIILWYFDREKWRIMNGDETTALKMPFTKSDSKNGLKFAYFKKLHKDLEKKKV